MSRFTSILRLIGSCIFWSILFLATAWTFGAIYFDAPFPGVGNLCLALLWLAGLLFGFLRVRGRKRLLVWLGAFLLVIIPWLFKKPQNTREWAPEFAHVPSAIINGDLVTFTNFRHFDYHTDGTPIEKWETRSFHLSKLRHMDFFMTYWGTGRLVGHPIFSFDFGDDGHVAFSIESRREKGEIYGLISGLYKQFELLYIVSDESDVIRSRTNFRKDENVYLYRLHIKDTTTRLRFSEYVDSLNRRAAEPEWYNVVTANCTTAVRGQITTRERHSLDWRILANGKLDELLNERGILDKSMPFPELKAKSHINPVAHEHPEPEKFSEVIREGVPGF